MEQQLKLRGMTTNNLRNIDLDIPKNKITVFTGVSGSENLLSFSIQLQMRQHDN
ncbi:hypothetical protein MGH68_10300 [Erysipelothrix sp. D19-032]